MQEKTKTKKGDKMENFTVVVDGKKYSVQVAPGDANIEVKAAPAAQNNSSGKEVHVHAPLPGNVFKVLVKPGDKVSDGQTVMVLEAMKMETEIQSPVNGVVKSVDVNQGDTVENGQTLVTIQE